MIQSTSLILERNTKYLIKNSNNDARLATQLNSYPRNETERKKKNVHSNKSIPVFSLGKD